MLTHRISSTPLTALHTTPRVERLKRTLLSVPHTYSDELARLTHAAYEAHEAEPAVLRRAYAFAAMLEGMTVYLRPMELLAGNRTPAPGVQLTVPASWWEARKDPRTGAAPMQYEAAALYPAFLERLSPAAKQAQDALWAGFPAGSASGFGHIIAGYDMLVRKGAKAIAREARSAYEHTPGADTHRRANLLAMAVAWEAFAEWGTRYAELAEAQAATEADPRRREELRQMSRTLRRVPADAPTNFREALQTITLMQFALLLEQPNGGSISMGGIDRVLEPFLQRDLSAGVLTWAQAEELTDSFYVKLMENAVWPREVVMFANLSVGGRDASGADAANDMSLLFLESTARIRSTHPMLSVRWHERQDPAFFRRACELIRMGLGLPALFADEAYEAVLEGWGVSHEAASRYGIVGCVEPAVMGLVHGQTLGGHVNLLMCLELALNDGKRLTEDVQLGPHTGFLRDFTAMEQVWQAYEAQVRYACELNVEAVNAVAAVQKELYGYPFMSAAMTGAIEAGRDLTEGAEVNHPTVCMVGVSNVADAMAAMADQVFDRQLIDPATLLAALKADYVGYEAVRLRLLNDENKFGNGSDKAVAAFRRCSDIQERALCCHPGPRGGYFTSGVWAITWHVSMGEKTGASPDGRRAGEPLVDGIGAVSGRARSGPTAVSGDVAAVDARAWWQGGYTFNMKFNKALLEQERGLDRLTAYANGFFAQGGMQLQINTIDRDTLLRAQREPEHYADLIVRVAGFSAYFCTLSKAVQDEIINRTEHGL